MGAFLNDHNIKQFHMELVSLTDDEAVVHFHYCPMCGAWTKLTDNEKEIGMICDCAMDVDRGVFDLYEHIGFKLEKAIGWATTRMWLHLSESDREGYMIVNEPKKYIGDYGVDSVRAAYENRGRWYYYLVKEGLDQGCP